MQASQRKWDGGPIIVYQLEIPGESPPTTSVPGGSGSGSSTTGSNGTSTGGIGDPTNPPISNDINRPSGPGPIIQFPGQIGDILASDPRRSRGDEPLGGRWPIYGTLPELGRAAPSENLVGRMQRGLLDMVAEQPPEVSRAYTNFVLNSPESRERTWFELNAATWPLIKVNGAQKLAAAHELRDRVRLGDYMYGRGRKIEAANIALLHEREAQLRSDLIWHAGSYAALVNVLAGTINTFATLTLNLLKPYVPLGLEWGVLYDAMDQVFRQGAYFDRAAWERAINEAFVQAMIEDRFLRSSKLRQLLAEFARFAENLLRIQEGERDRIELRREIERQLDAIRRELDRYQSSGDSPEGFPQVTKELMRQPNYVISVARDYQRMTGKAVTSGAQVPGIAPAGFNYTRVGCMLLPIGLLLGIRRREDNVLAAKSGKST